MDFFSFLHKNSYEEPFYKRLWYKYLMLSTIYKRLLLSGIFLILTIPIIVLGISFLRTLSIKGNNVRVEAEFATIVDPAIKFSDQTASNGKTIIFTATDAIGIYAKPLIVGGNSQENAGIAGNSNNPSTNSSGSNSPGTSGKTSSGGSGTLSNGKSSSGGSTGSNSSNGSGGSTGSGNGGSSGGSGGGSSSGGGGNSSGGSGGTSGGSSGGGTGSGGSNGGGGTSGGSGPTPTLTLTPTRIIGPTYTPTPTPVGSTNPTPTPQPPIVIYKEGISGNYVDITYGYSSRDTCNTSAYFSYPCSYAITFNSGGALAFKFNPGSLDASGYHTLALKMETNGKPLSDFGVQLKDGSGNPLGSEITLSSNYLLHITNDWNEMEVPIDTLNPNNKPIVYILFTNKSGQNLPTVFYDDLEFSSDYLTSLPLAMNILNNHVVLGTQSDNCVHLPPDNGSGSIINILLPSKGLYDTYYRIKTPNVGSSFYAKIDNNCPDQINSTKGTDTWDWIKGRKINSLPGTSHTITLYGNSQNIEIDQIIFSQFCIPEGLGYNCVSAK